MYEDLKEVPGLIRSPEALGRRSDPTEGAQTPLLQSPRRRFIPQTEIEVADLIDERPQDLDQLHWKERTIWKLVSLLHFNDGNGVSIMMADQNLHKRDMYY
ncbi:hypothetical protein M5K25_004544 [Dendrobium thyrsiflorum]|uniref:Uncharacterized protein n=1 Tax=Dendrobium thyrsiflorum TaxID=117978 RepID=A0ABD0VUF6_DENTH